MPFERFKDWLERYRNAWETRDPDAAQRLFTEEATYQVTPFREPEMHRTGIRDYWVRATAEQSNVQFGYQMLASNGDTGICRWNCQFDIESDGSHAEIDGIFVFTLTDDNACSTFQEWWHERVSARDE